FIVAFRCSQTFLSLLVDYESTRKKLSLAELQSDLASDAENRGRGMRSKKKRKFEEESEEDPLPKSDDSDQETLPTKKGRPVLQKKKPAPVLKTKQAVAASK